MTALSVSDVLRGYVDRGLFRNFHPGGKGDFGFLWLNHVPMQLQWKPASQSLVFKDVLPNIPAKGAMYRELRAFLKGRSEADLPDHRRVDPADFELLCQNRGSNVSIGLRLVAGSEEAAVRKLMLVMHEAFLLLNDRWLDYMHEEFGASLE